MSRDPAAAGARLALVSSNPAHLAALAAPAARPAAQILLPAADRRDPPPTAAARDRVGRVDIVLHLVGG